MNFVVNKLPKYKYKMLKDRSSNLQYSDGSVTGEV